MASSRAPRQPAPAQADTAHAKRDWLAFRMLIWTRYYSAPLYAEMDKKFGILQDEFAVLAALYDGASLSAKTICALTGRPKNSVSRAVARLIESGRIKSVTNVNDRREAHLSLLAEGRKLYERILPFCRERELMMMRALSESELATLDQLMTKLILYYRQNPDGFSQDY